MALLLLAAAKHCCTEMIKTLTTLLVLFFRSNDLSLGNVAHELQEKLRIIGTRNVILISPRPSRVFEVLNDTQLNWIVSRPQSNVHMEQHDIINLLQQNSASKASNLHKICTVFFADVCHFQQQQELNAAALRPLSEMS